MNCIIPSANLKIVNKALHTLARIGDELYIEAKNDSLQFATINQTKTSYVTYDFQNVFFSTYEIIAENGSAAASAGVTCKLLMKAMLRIFKTRGPKEKNIDWCKIEFNNNPTRIIVKIKYKQDVTITHSLKLIDMDNISVPYDRESMTSCIHAVGSFFSKVLTNFQISDEDISFDIKNNKVTVRNYDVASNNVGKQIRSQVVLNSNEFSLYNIGQECDITMSFKPFRAAVAFAEAFTLPIWMNFNTGGKPIILTVKNPIFETKFVLSTISPDGSTQSCAASSSVFGNLNKSRNAELTREERSIIEDLNWDSDFDVDDAEPVLNSKKKARTDKNEITNRIRDDTSKSKNSKHLEEEDMIPKSPESPRTKKLKVVFRRCFEPTYHESNLDFGNELAPNSDSE